jgi:hypothetical protein
MRDALVDTVAAYRRIPTSEPEYTIVAYWNPDPGNPRVEFVEVYVMNFRLKSAVCTCSRVPEFVCWIAAVVGKSAMTHYIDDYMVFETTAAKGFAQGVLHSLYDMLRLMPLDEDKNQASGAKATVLGVKCNMERAHDEGMVLYEPKDDG